MSSPSTSILHAYFSTSDLRASQTIVEGEHDLFLIAFSMVATKSKLLSLDLSLSFSLTMLETLQYTPYQC